MEAFLGICPRKSPIRYAPDKGYARLTLKNFPSTVDGRVSHNIQNRFTHPRITLGGYYRRHVGAKSCPPWVSTWARRCQLAPTQSVSGEAIPTCGTLLQSHAWTCGVGKDRSVAFLLSIGFAVTFLLRLWVDSIIAAQLAGSLRTGSSLTSHTT